MTQPRNAFFETHCREIAASAASLSVLPMWYPFFERSLYQRAQILQSKKPSDLSHTNFFMRRRNYYRGITANITTMQPLFPAAEWTLQTLLEKIREVNQRDPNLAEKLVAGFITGSTTALLANPYEATNIASQQFREPPAKAFLRILSKSGVKGFYTGFIPMALRNGSFVSGLFVTSPELSKMFDKMLPGTSSLHQFTSVAAGAAVSATIFTSIVVPFDIAAVMRQSDPSEEVYRSTFQAAKKAYQKHGVSALKTGMLMRLLACNIEMIGFNYFYRKYETQFSNSYKS